MEGLHNYIFSVTCAVIICGVVNGFFGKKGTITALIKLISGIFMVLTVISPWTKINIDHFNTLTEKISFDADSIVDAGQAYAQNEMREIIIQKTRTYILDKAISMGLDVTVEVSVNDDLPPVPNSVTVSGSASPFAKKALIEYIETNLAIPKENQIWI